MPQPLSKVAKNSNVFFTGDAFLKRPQLAPYVAAIIDNWSYCDTSLAEILSTFLSADFVVVNKIYQAFIGAEAHKRMLLAAAEHALAKDSVDYLLLDAVFKVTTASRKRRNQFAHHQWGYASEIPDGLLLLHPSYTSGKSAAFKEHYAQAVSILTSGDDERIRAWREDFPEFEFSQEIMVFRKSDFESDLSEAQLARSLFSQLSFALDAGHPGRDAMRSSLQSQPLVREELKKSKCCTNE